MRVRIFIDFWNLQLQWNRFHEKRGAKKTVKIPWDKTLPTVITHRVHSAGEYSGTHVYASVQQDADAPLRRFLHVMDGFSGYAVTVKERKPASRVHCSKCGEYIDECPHCRNTLRRTVEKGVDTSVVTDLITMSLDGLHDRAVLVTADADFVPAVEYLQRRGKKVTHLYFKTLGSDLRKACWDHLFLDDLMSDLLVAT